MFKYFGIAILFLPISILGDEFETDIDLYEKIINISGIFGCEIGYVNLKNIRDPKLLYKIYIDDIFKNHLKTTINNKSVIYTK